MVEDEGVLLYRAHAPDIVSYVALATSSDGIHFLRHPEPVLSPSEDYERFGCEDPRIAKLDGTPFLPRGNGTLRYSSDTCCSTLPVQHRSLPG